MNLTRHAKWKIIVWAFAFSGMVSRHMSLESLYMVRNKKVKANLHSSHPSMSLTWLSAMDSCYLFSYAIGNMVSGSLEDHYSLSLMISCGLFFSAFFYFVLIFLAYANIYSPFMFLICWTFQGIFQSTVWPGCVSLLGKWFDKKSRGKVMGLFSSSSCCGNFTSAFISGQLLNRGVKWNEVILVFAIIQITISAFFYMFIKDSPEKQLGEIARKDFLMQPIGGVEESIVCETKVKKGIPFLQALAIPNIINFALAYACVKFLAYGLIIWLPFYLSSNLHESKYIGTLVSLLDIGAVVGGILCGWLGDKIGERPPILSVYLILALPCLFFLPVVTDSNFEIYFFLIPVTGFFIGGVNLILASAIPADLAQNKKISNFYEAMATVAGIIDGSGGLGAGIGVFIIGNLAKQSWNYVFFFMISMAVVAFGLIFKISARSIAKIRNKRPETQSIEIL